MESTEDYLTLGPTPCDEKCAQVGSDNYPQESRKETRAYINQLYRMYPEVPQGARFASKSFPHDFGSYREVVVIYDIHDSAALAFAFKVEAKLPEEWDEEARTELGLD